MNAFNLLDNMDGILGGIGSLIGLFMGVLALKLGRPDMAALALAAGGASLGFLCFNFPPATIFLGDAGAFFIGFLLAAVGWQLAGVQFLTFGSPAAAIVLVLAYPIFDVTFVTVTRIIERRPVYVGGIDHTTHRLHAILGHDRRALWTVYALNALSGVAGLGALNAPAPVAWSLVVVAIGLYASLGVVLARVPVRSRRFLSVFLKSESVRRTRSGVAATARAASPPRGVGHVLPRGDLPASAPSLLARLSPRLLVFMRILLPLGPTASIHRRDSRSSPRHRFAGRGNRYQMERSDRMRTMKIFAIIAVVAAFAAGCTEDNPVRPPDEIAPPTNVTFVTDVSSIVITWAKSPFESSSRFDGYYVYVDTVSIAAAGDTAATGGGAFLTARKINSTPVTSRTYVVDRTGTGTALQQGKKYFVHVRTVREDDRISLASNEINSSPRPQGDNENTDANKLMWDYNASTDSRSGFGWTRANGVGLPYETSAGNSALIDFFMIEEQNSADNGSQFLSPAQAAFTVGYPTRHSTKFKDLGAGDGAWNTSIAPDTLDLSEVVKVINDHTYALYLLDKHWVKVRVTEFTKNLTPSGASSSIKLNRIRFTYAFQLIDDYGRFKPEPKGGF